MKGKATRRKMLPKPYLTFPKRHLGSSSQFTMQQVLQVVVCLVSMTRARLLILVDLLTWGS